jgi:hypothetical protein
MTGPINSNKSSAFPTHPAADVFPLMSPSELQELAADIKTNGLASAIVRDKGALSWTVAIDSRLVRSLTSHRASKSTGATTRSALSSRSTFDVAISMKASAL